MDCSRVCGAATVKGYEHVRVIADRTRSENRAHTQVRPYEDGRDKSRPTSNAFFQARGEEAERAFGALRHRPLLPAQ